MLESIVFGDNPFVRDPPTDKTLGTQREELNLFRFEPVQRMHGSG
jgi:hypothetical protein